MKRVLPIALTSISDTAAGYAVAIQSDGKIVVGGYAHIAADGHNEFAVARYNSDGSLDTTFSSDGLVTLFDSGGSLDDTAFAMAIEDDGTIVVGGQENGDLALGFFNSNGTVDTAHDADGIVTQDLGGTEKINALIAQSDGTIVAGGVKGNDFVIAKFTSTWILDTTFGASSGYTDTNMGGATGEGVPTHASPQSSQPIRA